MKNYSILAILLFITSCVGNQKEIILKADNVDGLTEEANITLNGIEIGEVKDLSIVSNGTIEIRCKINSDTKIPIDSKFKIENLDLLGSKVIKIELGDSLLELKDGDTIKLTKIESINLGDSLKNKVGGFLESLTSKQKQDSILIELRRLNDNLEMQNK